MSKEINDNTKFLVMGNGPSLRSVDFEQLNNSNVITLATNRISDICKKYNWHPDYYAAFFCEPFRGENIKLSSGKSLSYPGSKKVAHETRADIDYVTSHAETTCYVHDWYRHFLEPKDNLTFNKPFKWNRFQELPLDCFDTFEAPNNFLWHIATTALFQLAFHLGPKTIGVIGQDGYDINKELNHFDGYRGTEPESVKKSLFANERINRLHDAVKVYCDKNDVTIYNLSTESILKQHAHINFKNFMEYK